MNLHEPGIHVYIYQGQVFGFEADLRGRIPEFDILYS